MHHWYDIVHLLQQHVEKLREAIVEVRECWLDQSEDLSGKMNEIEDGYIPYRWREIFVAARTVKAIRHQFAPMLHLHGKLIDQIFKARRFRGIFKTH